MKKARAGGRKDLSVLANLWPAALNPPIHTRLRMAWPTTFPWMQCLFIGIVMNEAAHPERMRSHVDVIGGTLYAMANDD
jgi:hypothetical protein